MTDLERTRDYFRTQANDGAVPAEDRELWGHLADEIDDYLHPVHEQVSLL